MFIQHLTVCHVHRYCMVWKYFFYRKLLKSFLREAICRFCPCIQNQIIHKHLHVDYNPLKGMLILISSLELSTVPFAAGPES